MSGLRSVPLDRGAAIVAADGLLLLAMLNWLPFDDGVVTGLSILAFVAVLWLSEAIHVSVTALLVPLLAVVLGVFDTGAALESFADPIIFLFLGGFALAAALHAQQLDQAIADRVLALSGGRLSVAVLLIFAVTAALSMWISNTATTAMMLPLVLGLLSSLDRDESRRVYLFVLLGVAYCASIGGIATLVGSPPNAIAAAEVELDFLAWMRLGLPLSLLLLPIAVAVLYAVIRPPLDARVTVRTQAIEWTGARIATLAIFAVTAACWVFSAPLNAWLGGLSSLDALIAMAALIALAACRVVGFKDIERTTDWGVLLLFGGGLTLSEVLRSTGTSVFLAESIGAWLDQAPLLLLIAGVVAFVIFLTELASNTASAALLVPVFTSIAGALGVEPVLLAAAIAVAASCAFMLPVATPPNAIVFGSGLVPQRDMMRVGLVLNLVAVVVITLYARLIW